MLLSRSLTFRLRYTMPLTATIHPAQIRQVGTSTTAEDLESFSAHLQSSDRILALLGAGLSASSGLPTFRGAGGIWRNHEAMRLATPEAFASDPGLVWQFYSYRRHMALKAQPNKAHYALAELAKRKKNFITLSQNVDGTKVQYLNPNPCSSLA
jgi:NAD-dependent deacetylase sirtuin 5